VAHRAPRQGNPAEQVRGDEHHNHSKSEDEFLLHDAKSLLAQRPRVGPLFEVVVGENDIRSSRAPRRCRLFPSQFRPSTPRAPGPRSRRRLPPRQSRRDGHHLPARSPKAITETAFLHQRSIAGGVVDRGAAVECGIDVPQTARLTSPLQRHRASGEAARPQRCCRGDRYRHPHPSAPTRKSSHFVPVATQERE
jgi:hypothetical protein